jgi:hypothetical protein
MSPVIATFPHLFLIMTSSQPNILFFMSHRSSLIDVPTDRKVQTIKNLEKPWAALATPEQDRTSPSSIASSRSASPEPTTSFTHSAASTILLDDSHAKAALQPHNHLCVREYTRSQRHADLITLGLNPPGPPPRAPPPPPPPLNLPETTTTPPQDEDEQHNAGKGNKRKRGKERQLSEEDGGGKEGEVLDETLLAVIGILHAARLQSSVAGWLRAGALLRSQSQDSKAAEWFDDPALMSEWACRGREAMRELGLEIEHGVKP